MLTYTHTFNGPLSGTTQVSRYQKGKTNLDFTEVRDSEWQWHQLGHMQVSLQTDNHTSTPLLSFFTGRMAFLPPNQQHQSTKGSLSTANLLIFVSYSPHHADSCCFDHTLCLTQQCNFTNIHNWAKLQSLAKHIDSTSLSLLLSRCWLGGRKGIRPVKTWVVECWHGYLSGARCRLSHGPADPGSPGKRAVKRVCMCVCVSSLWRKKDSSSTYVCVTTSKHHIHKNWNTASLVVGTDAHTHTHLHTHLHISLNIDRQKSLKHNSAMIYRTDGRGIKISN